MTTVTWHVYTGREGHKGKMARHHVGDFPTKRQAYNALLTALGGSKPLTGVYLNRDTHTYFAVAKGDKT